MADAIAFDLIPAAAGELSADAALEAALTGVVEDSTPVDEKLPLGRGWALDDFGGLVPVRGVATLEAWIDKTLRTARFAHPIYSDGYATEYPDDMIGSPFSSRIAGLIADAIKDALLVHDRITEVHDFKFSGGGDTDMLVVEFRVITDEDDHVLITLPIGS